jgi:quinol monooxygenase YgiN
MVDTPWRSFAKAGDREYLALISFLPLRRYRTLPAFFRFVRAIGKQLEASPGLVGFSLRAKFLSRRFYTFSVWEDEGALMAFVGKTPHLETMRALGPHLGGTKFVRWSLRGPGVPPSWEEALRRLREG